jgi:hypothetical protein
MNGQLIRDLLHEVVDDIEPADRLDAIRAATARTGRRTRRGWWAAGGAGLAAASVVTAFAVTTGGAQHRDAPAPADAPTTASTTPTATLEPGHRTFVTAYYAGDTVDGRRLYAERRDMPENDPLSAAEHALAVAPEDPDHTNLWPADAIEDVSFDGAGEDGLVGVRIDPAYRDRPASMAEDDAALALEQVVRTLQSAVRADAPVQFLVDGNPVDQVLGVPISEPLVASPDLDVLAPVSLSVPSEGQVVDNDEGLRVRGRAASADGDLNVVVTRVDGTVTVGDGTLKGMMRPDRLTAFDMSFTMSEAAPGVYDVVATVRSSDGAVDTDTRRITVVE